MFTTPEEAVKCIKSNDNVFLHYRAGGNWNKEGMKLHIDLSNKLKKILV